MLALTLPQSAAQSQNAGTSSGPGDISGWWRATVQYAGESDDIYLHFPTAASGQATFSIPSVGTSEASLGPYITSPSQITLSGVRWKLERDADRSLRGVLPDGLVPAHSLPAAFRRSEPPKMLPLPQPSGPPPAPVWKQSLGAPVTGDLAYDPVTRRLIAATFDGRVFSLNPINGARSWSVPVSSHIRSAPQPSGGAIFVATDDRILKLAAKTGRILWSAGLGKPRRPILSIFDPKSSFDYYSASPLIHAGIVYVGSRDGCVHAFSQSDGRETQKFCSYGEITARPVIDQGRIYYGSYDGQVYAARLSDGAPLWRHDTKGSVPRDLAISGNLILAGSRSYDLDALDKSNGSRVWSRYIWWSWVDSAAEIHARDVLIGSSDSQRIYDLDIATGKPIWTSYLGGWAWAKPTRAKGLVFAGLTGTTSPYVGKRDGGLAALDASTGHPKWIFRTPHGAKDETYGFSSAPLAIGNRLYAADLNGTVFCFSI